MVSLLWGVSFVFTKRYLEVIDPIVFTAYSFLVAGIILGLISKVKGRKLLFRIREGILLGFFLMLLELPQMIGLSKTTAANTAFITAIGILFVPFLARIIYGHRIDKFTWLALVTAFLGVNLLTGGISSFNQGDLWISLSAFGALLYVVFSEHFEKEKHSDFISLCSQQFLAVGIISILVAFFADAHFGLKTPGASWMPLLWLTLIFTIVPYILLQSAEKYATESEITFYGVLEPLIGGLAAWTIGLETATPVMVLGGITIVLSLFISEFSELHIKRKLIHLG